MTAIIPGRVRLAPRIPSWHISRAQLVKKIERGLDDGLVIVRGPAGGGKTAAVAGWAWETERDGTWVSVRTDAVTRFAFWDQVLRSLGAERTPDGRTRVGINTESQLYLALADVFGERPHVLVVDDYHLIEDRAVDDDVAWLVTNTECSIIVSTRTVEDFESGAAEARLGPTVLRPEELAFDRRESAEVLAIAVSVPPTVVDAAFERIGGWPLATRALALELGRADHSTDIDEALEALAATFAADEPRLPRSLENPAAREFATRVAVADWVTPELAMALAPDTDVELMLDQFEMDGLGSWTRTPAGPAFTFQTFVRAALLQPRNALPPATMLAVRRAYTDWADRTGHPAIAGAQALAMNDWPRLADLAQKHFRRIMLTYRPEWGRLLTAVPFEQLRKHPVLGSVMIQLLNADSGASARTRAMATVLLSSIAPLRDRGSTVDRLWRNASALAAERISGRYRAAARTSDRIADLIDALTPEEHESLTGILPVLYLHIGTTRLYDDDLVGAVAPLREALLSDSDTQWSHLHARSLLAVIAALRGDFSDVTRHTRTIEREITIPEWRGTYSAAGYHLSRAIEYVERQNPASARAELSLLDRHFETIEHWPLILHVRSLISLVEGSSTHASALLPGQIRIRSKRSATSSSMNALLAGTHTDLLVAAGEIRSAERAIANAENLGFPALTVAAARIALAKADTATALALTRELVGHDSASPRTLADALLIRSVAHQLSGRTSDAIVAFRQSLGVLEQYGLRLPLSLVAREPLDELLEHLDAATASRARSLLKETTSLLQPVIPSVKLTGRERAVLAELSRGGNAKSIATSLFVSPNTVKSQTKSVYRKLGVSTRLEAVRVAQNMGLLDGE